MKVDGVPAGTRILPSAISRRFEGGEQGVLILHGFTGWPGELVPLAERLQKAGCAVSLPRLPGHGTNATDFMESGWRDWLRRATDEYLELAAAVRKVHVIGYSMGGLLAILLAAHFPTGRLVLVAPAIKVRNRLIAATPFVALLFRRLRRRHGQDVQEFQDPDMRFLQQEYWAWRFTRQSADLWKLQRMARRALPRVTADTLVLLGRSDDAVPLSAISLIRARIGAPKVEQLVLEKSGHRIYADDDGEEAIGATLRWLTER